MLELHIWGPAFGLPSIDAHCLAALAYLQQAVPAGNWLVVASSNPALSPTYELPALKDDKIWIGGFRNIFHYVAQHSSGKWILDAELEEQEEADCVAFSAFLDSHAQPLLDLSLYIMSENFTTITRPVYSTFQPFPLPYLTPSARRSTARSRTAHLGLAALDVETYIEANDPSLAGVPERLRKPRAEVSKILTASSQTAAQIRLDALASECFEPLEALRAKKRYLVSNSQFTSLDCLALGYLSLMLIPELPQPWLARTMRQKFPRLAAWTQELRTEIFGGAIGIGDVYGERRLSQASERLPWRKPETNSIWRISTNLISTIIEGYPSLAPLKARDKIMHQGGKVVSQSLVSNGFEVTLKSLGAICLATAASVSCMWLKGVFSEDRILRDSEKVRSALEDAGNLA
ncbi:Metaxin-like protein [Blumeria hordei DH14]|uniref:Metaxin-like protein n=1 Tax=Blumeria graminis f. sp. hordei (strain DH14) TaxID=546991 RepID=N1JMK7_BLUG1|nr:Metaxin-like protein [Blumeria hordei DH14]